MSTAHSIDVNLQVNAMATGVSPIDGGRISFPLNISGPIEQGADMICKRITYADLAVSGSNRIFRINVGPLGTLRYGIGGPTVKNLVAQNVTYPEVMKLVCIKTSAVGIITTEYAGMPTICASGDGVILISGQMPGPGDSPETTSIFSITWSQAAIDALGSANFFCDLILSAEP